MIVYGSMDHDWCSLSHHATILPKNPCFAVSFKKSLIKKSQQTPCFRLISFPTFKYYLKHEDECFIRYKTRGAVERFISDKARIASVLDSFKNDPFYTHLVTLLEITGNTEYFDKIQNNRNSEKYNDIGNFISTFQLTCSHL